MIYESTDGGKKVSINSAHCAGAVVIAAILVLAGLRYLFNE